MVSFPILKQKVLSAVSAADATGIYVIPSQITQCAVEVTVYVVWSHASAAGAVVLESSPDATYTGTWANEGTISWAAIDSVGKLHLTAASLELRVRVSSAVTSGTADVWVVCLPT